MQLGELHYDLPTELIAQRPAERRDQSRLLVLERADGTNRHAVFAELAGLLPGGSLLVLNDTRVLPARLRMHRRSGGWVEGLFVREAAPGQWEIMVTGAARLKNNEHLLIEGAPRALRLRQRRGAGLWLAEPDPPGNADEILSECGLAPLPPYIRRGKETDAQDKPPTTDHQSETQASAAYAAPSRESKNAQDVQDLERYQTIYARRPGAIAAPTAGLHFSPRVFQSLAEAGIESVYVTLHVGMGTFAPIRCEDLADHRMPAEGYDCPAETAAAINHARRAGRPVVAVGTTVVRVLETCADESGRVTAGRGQSNLFVYPPYRFRVVDKMITNFHLPGSTLLALLFAFAGREQILSAYREAIARRYRFYSFGDAMLIL